MREVAIVVLSILIAFSLDAWWDGQSERSAERDLLASLAAELAFNLEALGEPRSVAEGSLQASEALLALTGPNATIQDPFIVDSLLGAAIWVSSFDPQTGTLEQILRLDGLRLIRSDGLRRELATWDEQLRDYREDETYAVQELGTDLLPFLRSRIPGFGLQDQPNWHQSGSPVSRIELLSNLEFANLMGERVYRARSLLRELSDVESLIQRMLQLLEAGSA